MACSASLTALSGRWSIASASAERLDDAVVDSAPPSCQSSSSSIVPWYGSRCFLRYVLMNVFVRMRYSQALRFVPCWNWRNAAYALTKVSCTRSCASAGLRVMRRRSRVQLVHERQRLLFEEGPVLGLGAHQRPV